MTGPDGDEVRFLSNLPRSFEAKGGIVRKLYKEWAGDPVADAATFASPQPTRVAASPGPAASPASSATIVIHEWSFGGSNYIV